MPKKGGGQPAKSVVDSVTAACAKVFRSAKLAVNDIPEGVTWRTKDPRQAYKFGPELGHGNYGVVHAATHIQSGRVYACKILRKQPTHLQRQYVVAEVATLHRVTGHPNVASLHEVWEDSGYVYIFMEACLGGELFDVIIQRGHFSERDAAVVMKVLLDVVNHCHQRGVAHRDLKPENFLLKRKALDPTIPLRAEDLRAVDFGLAVFLEPDQTLKELLGSPFYVAPELLRGNYGYPADAWSAGVILYILLSGAPPFNGSNERQIFRHVLKQPLDLTSQPWPHVSSAAKDLVAKLLDRDPHARLSAKQALEHPWLKTTASDGLLQSDVLLERLRGFAQMSKLQGILMNLIAKNLSSDGIETLRDAFNDLDKNGDGHLSFEELRQGLEEASMESQQCGNIAQMVMDALDVSGDGTIDYHEFLAAVVDRQRTLTDQTLAEMFTYLDKNNDGRISPQELSESLAESGIIIPHATLKELMNEMLLADNSQDVEEPTLTNEIFADLLRGGLLSDKIQLSQLEDVLSDMQYSFRVHNRFRQLAMLVIARATPVSELQGLKELFEALDVDKSGCLTLSELRRGLKATDSELGDEEIENLLDFMDVDGSSTIDYHEFVMGVLEDKQLLTEAKLRAAFDFFDTDHNGQIDIGEVEKVVKDLGIKMKQGVSPRDLVALADANEDQVVDFEEFREMMLNAEPNLLINRQQSLMARSSSSSFTSKSSGISAGNVDRAFSQPLSLRQELQSPPELEARGASLPMDAIPKLARRELANVGEIATKKGPTVKSIANGQMERRLSADAERRASTDTAGGASTEGSEEQLSVVFPRSKSVRVHNPFTEFQEVSWHTTRHDPNSPSQATDSAPSRNKGDGLKESQDLRPENRQILSLPSRATLSGLSSLSRQRSSSVSWDDETPQRRRRQLVFLGNSSGLALGPPLMEMDSVDVLLDRASQTTVQENGAASSRIPSGENKTQNGVSKPRWSYGPSSPSKLGDVQETILEDEVLTASRMNGGHVGSSTMQQQTSRGTRAELKSMLSFMEDQWSKTSFLAKGKAGSPPNSNCRKSNDR